MNAIPKKQSFANANLQLAFDVGHSSIGWAVLEKTGAQPSDIKILGCGSVIFRADDCLASSRRAYRRQRRHIRSTRQRIARMKILLKRLDVLTEAELDKAGCAWPWKLAAQILQGGELLTWPELWDVLRWYAHNRGYDGNERWSKNVDSENEELNDAALDEILKDSNATEDQKKDAEKVKAAKKFMRDLHTNTMAETFCAICGIDPLGKRKSANLAGDKRPKGQNAAFPRKIVESEVRKILRAHFGKLKAVDEKLERALLGKDSNDKDAWKEFKFADLKLPKRYEGGLLFGQLVPRFDNRIISQCPFTFAENYQKHLDEGLSPKDAKHKAEIAAKVPSKNCLEFLEFRWAMTLANIGIGFGNETYEDGKKLRPLKIDERLKVDARVRQLGFLKIEKDEVSKKTGLIKIGKNELRDFVLKETGCERHNLDSLLLHPDAKDGLKLVPVSGNTTAFRLAFSCFDAPKHDEKTGLYHDDSTRRRFVVQLLRQKTLTLNEIVRQLEKTNRIQIADKIRQATKNEVSKNGKVDETKLQDLLAAEFHCEKLKGRARFSRAKMEQAVQQVFHKENPIHPLQEKGCLEQTEGIKQAAIQKELAEQTNNHLVRHRLRILVGDSKAKRKRKPGEPKPGLLEDIIEEFANGDKQRIGRITIELARDLQEMSGMDNKKKAKALAAKLENHKQVSEELAAKLRDAKGNPLRDADGKPFFSKPGLIRKARILHDLENRCPYTGHDIEFVHLVYPHLKFGRADKDHVIPRSQRLSDALEAQIITFSEINLLKSNRTAIQFIRDMNLPGNHHHKDHFGFKTEAQFLRDVDALWPKSDPFKRARAGGAKPTDDEARCWRRKQFLLKEKWDEKDFTPADLTQTRHIVKLAAQQLEAAFLDLAPEQRPPVVPLIGAVTAKFRDQSWKLIGELAAVNPIVRETLNKGAKEWDAGKNFNPKKAIREITHLHHALDALTLGLVANLLVPSGHRSMDGDLARVIVKGKLTVDKEKNLDELGAFKSLCAKLRLPQFAKIDNKNRLYIENLPEPIKKQIRQRLAEKRVVQHIPARMDGMPTDQNMWRLRGWKPDGKAILEKHSRDTFGKRKLDKPKSGADNKIRLIGWNPEKNNGKLKDLKAVLITNENFGAALDPEPKIIPYHKVYDQIFKGVQGEKSLIERNGGKMPRILRSGHIINVASGRYNGTWRITSIKNKQKGINVNLGQPDTVRTEDEATDFETGKKKRVVRPDCKHEVNLASLLKAGLTFEKIPLTGIIALCRATPEN